MKVIISVTRKTEYSSIVEMSEEKYERLKKGWDGPTQKERDAADQEINKLIEANDWQDDELMDVDKFEPFKE